MDQAATPTLTLCTLTGSDDKTDAGRLLELGEEFPFIEWGILYSATQQGKGRYPSFDWIENLAARINGSKAYFALHVCGRAVFDLIDGTGHVAPLARAFDRVQVNFCSSNHPLDGIRAMVQRHVGQVIITQHNDANSHLWADLATEPNHSVLFDASGGRGIERADWPAPLPGVRCGYAGGLGPDNVERMLPLIQRAAGAAQYWIDLEGKLRDEQDRFDLSRASSVIEVVQAFRSPWSKDDE